jgi:hypothetical protein
MKIIQRIILTFLISAYFIFLSAHIYVNLFGKQLLISKLEPAFNRKVSIKNWNTYFPLGIHASNIEINGLCKIDEVSATGGLYDIFRRNFNLSKLKIIHPVVTIEQGFANSVAQVVGPDTPSLNNQNAVLTTQNNLNPLVITHGKFLFPSFCIKKLEVFNGIVHFIDKSINKEGVSITVENIKILISNLNLTGWGSHVVLFEINGIMPWEKDEAKGKLELKGWIDYFKMDIQAILKITDIDAIYLYPYYSNWVDLEKARIQQANLNFNCNIKGVNNDVSADCHLELVGMVRKVRPAEEPQQKAEKITDAVLDMFKSMDNGKVVLDFVLHTKLDRPEFGFNNFRSAFEDKLMQARTSAGMRPQDMLSWPVRWMRSGLKSGADLSNAFIDGVVGISNGIKKFFEDRMERPASAQ